MESLVVLRVTGAVAGILVALWAGLQFRARRIGRFEFVFLSLLGLGVVIVGIEPDAVSAVTEMLALQGQQHGRLIALLLFSNMVLWILLLSTRSGESLRSTQFDQLVRALAVRSFSGARGDRLPSVTVIIPALNEAENLRHLLPGMPSEIEGRSCGVLVVDDGSDDETADVVRQFGHAAISNPINRGGGAALRLGYDVAMQHGVDIVVTMDADGQHRPEDIEGLVNVILRENADVVIGSRLLGSREKDSVVRLVGIYVFNWMIFLMAGVRVSDCSNGFRAFRASTLSSILLTQDQFHTAELIIDAARKGLKIAEAPVTVLRRHSGRSKKGANLSYGVGFFKTVVKTWFRA